jgi:hypothetical protein
LLIIIVTKFIMGIDFADYDLKMTLTSSTLRDLLVKDVSVFDLAAAGDLDVAGGGAAEAQAFFDLLEGPDYAELVPR